MKTVRNLFAPGEVFGSMKTPLVVTRVPAGEEAEEPVVVDLTTKDSDTPPERILFVSRNGDLWSYPYNHMGMIESPTPEEIIIQGECQAVETIILYGVNLEHLVTELNAQTVREIAEGYEGNEWTVEQIVITRRKGEEVTHEGL